MTDREAFEAWCCKRWAGDRNALTISDDGEYMNGHVQFAWCAWQEATKREREACIDVVRCIGGPFAVDAEAAIRARAEGEEHGS